MNSTVTSFNTSPVTRLKVSSSPQDHESFLDRIISKLTKISKAFSVKGHAVQQHKSFIDENLLDPLMGPEKSRTLRR